MARSRRTSSKRRSRRSSRGGGYGVFLALAAVIVCAYAYLHAHNGKLPSLGSGSGSGSNSATGPATSAGSGADTGGATTSGAFVFATGTTSEPTFYRFIDSAHTNIDMTMYELNDTAAVNDLIARKKAGVDVRVILDQKEKSTNQSAYAALTKAGVGVVWSSTAYSYTHQKTLTVDGRESLILTGNLTSNYYSLTRDFGYFDTDRKDVAAVVTVFDADYAHKSVTPSDADDLLWSPTTAQDRVLAVINGAHKSLDVEAEEFNDTAVVNALAAKAKAGVAVRIVVESPSQYKSSIAKVVAAGGKVVGYSSSTGLYIHAKIVVADYGLADQTVELGSMNMTSNSLNQNRELGIVLRDKPDIDLIEHQVSADFAGGTKV
ncbi:hypothetical protein KDL01_14955 [Actinospica durhamensis]|uniref:PLD phosphodiesterase domain-containing protein n=1 Tax=Actinospica durhamensis TaxID=1508375 RepID=A0A941ENM8_9ACTN|nr:phospholipase D-like domain-containing protein [Actinospica durhamensis]MBR7834571.1 hypothetical protein [Actinospica durhamensis]